MVEIEAPGILLTLSNGVISVELIYLNWQWITICSIFFFHLLSNVSSLETMSPMLKDKFDYALTFAID